MLDACRQLDTGLFSYSNTLNKKHRTEICPMIRTVLETEKDENQQNLRNEIQQQLKHCMKKIEDNDIIELKRLN